jgi:hypothetical protein
MRGDQNLPEDLLLLRNTDDFAAKVIENRQVLGAKSSVPPVEPPRRGAIQYRFAGRSGLTAGM